MITADDVTVGKPDPEPYRRGAEILGFDVQDCIVVEDAPSGAKAGKAAVRACWASLLRTQWKICWM